jgi:hypothetical protein
MEAARRPRPVLWIGLLALGLAGAFTLLTAPLGPRLIEIAEPEPGHTRSNHALEVFLRFPNAERVRPETLSVRINGADVTDAFNVAENGAIGDVVRLVDGENRLEVAIFGQPWWGPSRLVEHRAQLRFRVVRPLDLYRG